MKQKTDVKQGIQAGFGYRPVVVRRDGSEDAPRDDWVRDATRRARG